VTRAEAVINLDAIAANLLSASSGLAPDAVMAVVKADAYGHGMVPVAQTAREFGAGWLGVALPSEALALRTAGDAGRILAWLWAPGDSDVSSAVQAGVDLSISSEWALEEVLAAGRSSGIRPRIHMKVDTGLSRNGCSIEDWPRLVASVAASQSQGDIEVVAVWSHLANADVPLSDPLSASVREQHLLLNQAVDAARSYGLVDLRWHLANSAATLQHPECHGDLVRIGIAMYGVSPFADQYVDEPATSDRGLIPAMTLRARIALVKQIPSGASVSYGSAWTAEGPTTVALVPLGYADGIPRAASGSGWVTLADSGGSALPVVGRIAMDQFVVAVPTGVRVQPGDWVTVFGDSRHGAPSAQDWARASGSIGYEIVTRIGSRVPRIYLRHEVGL